MQRLLDGQMMQMTSEQEADFIAEQAAAAASPTKDALKVRAAAQRYAIEVAGTTATVNGATLALATDRDSQTKWIGKTVVAQLNPAATDSWKLADGTWATLNAQAIVQCALAAAAHVQAAFDQERQVDAQIDAGTITTFDQVDGAFTS